MFPVVTLIVGHTMASRLDKMKDTRALERERVARAEQRRHRVLERRAEFQRGVLIELQDVGIEFARATGASFHEDGVAHRRDGVSWGSQQLPEGLSDNHAQLQRRFNILVSRIGAGAVHDCAMQLSALCHAGAYARSENEALSAMAGLSAAMIALNDEVGRELRRLDQIEDEITA